MVLTRLHGLLVPTQLLGYISSMQEAARQSLAALGKGHAPKRPRLVIHCEASIVQEMHELAHKNSRSVSSLAEWAMARLLADFSAGRIEFDPEYTPDQPLGHA